MIAQALNLFFPTLAEEAATPVYAQETVREYLQRIKDELLWPRILVRNAPPPDEVQPNAPDRL